MGAGATRGLPARPGRAPTPTTRCTPSTARCTTTSAAAPTTCCTGCTQDAGLRSRGEARVTVADRARSDERELASRRPPRTGQRPARRAACATGWSSGPRATSRRGCRARDLFVIKPSGVAYDELTPGDHDRVRPRRQRRRGRAAQPSSDTAAHAYVYRHMPEVGGVVHTHSHLRHRLGGPRRADPVRAHRDGRRVRRRDPGRAVRADRRRLDRPRHRRHAGRAPLPGRADAQPRRLHHRQRRAGRGQGGGDVRGRRPHGPPRPAARRAAAASPRPTSTRCTTATRTSTASPQTEQCS